MKNFFSKNLWLQGLKKIRVSGLAFSIIIILLNAFLPIVGIAENSYYSSTRVPEPISYNMVVPFCILILVLVPIISHDMFSFLNERNQSDFYHAIPHKRTCVYVSFTASVLTWAFGTVIASTLVNALLYSMANFYTLSFSVAVLGMLPYLVLSVLMAGVMILAMTVTGTKISNFLIAILFFLFFRVMGTLCIIMLQEFAPVLNTDFSVWKYFNFEFFLPYKLLESVVDADSSVYMNAKLLIYTLVIGFGFLALGCVAYNKRRSESATKSAPNKWLQHVYRVAVTLPFVFLIAFFIALDGFETYQFILVIFALLVYVLYELITTKKIKSVVKSLPYMIIPVVITVMLVSGIRFAANVIENDRFAADEVAGFSFIQSYDRTYEGINTAEILVDNKEAAVILSNAFDYTVNKRHYNEDVYYQQVLIKLESGRLIGRNLYFPQADYDRLKQLRIEAPEFSKSYLEIPRPDSVNNVYTYNDRGIISANDMSELYKTFYEEYNALSDADKRWVKNPKGEFTYVTQIALNGYLNSTRYNADYYILFEKTPITAVKYLNLISENKGYGYYGGDISYYYEQLKKFAEQEEKGNVSYAYASLDIQPITGDLNDSRQFTFKKESENVIPALRDVFGALLNDDQSFVYDDPKKIYKIEIHLETDLTSEAVYYDETTLDVSYYKEDFADVNTVKTEIAEPDRPVIDTNLYIHEEYFVRLDDQKLEQIKEIMCYVYTMDTEKTPN